MNEIDEQKLCKAVDDTIAEHVAQTRVQRVTLRELILDAIEEAGFDIVRRETDADRFGGCPTLPDVSVNVVGKYPQVMGRASRPLGAQGEAVNAVA